MPNYSDLNITPGPDIDKNFFNFKATNLKIDKIYAIKFQWVYPDGSVSPWSSGKFVTTNTESIPAAPISTVEGGAGFIKASLTTFPANAFRVDVYVINGIFGTGKIAHSFFSAGTTTIAAPAGTYQVQLITVTPSKINGTPTQTFSAVVTDPSASIAVLPSVAPSTPTVSSVVGAIQLSWNGKTSTGADQPSGFRAAKVYVGTSADFTPVDTGNSGANQVDTLKFANGQNTLNIGVGTLVNSVALTYNTNYFVKIKTTNGNVAQDSTAVSATGNPVQIGKVGSGDIVTVTADQITTGTLQSNSIITVGATSGKRVELRATGDPFEIFGTGGTSLLSYNTSSNKLVVTGEGSFTGAITATSGSFTGDLYASNGLFSVISGSLTATSGSVGNWIINSGKLASSPGINPSIELDPLTPQFILRGSGLYSGFNITLAPPTGITAGSTFSVTPSGVLTSTSGFIGGWQIFSGELKSSNSSISLNSTTGEITSTGNGVGGGEIFSGAFGTLSLSGGGISHSSMLSFSAPSLNSNFVDGGDYAYLIVNPAPSTPILALIGQGNASGDLQFRIMKSQGFTNFARGYHMIGLDEFAQSSINSAGTAYGTVVSAAGQLVIGRAFYYGSQSSSSGINGEAFGAKIGDVYLSTN